MIVYHGTIEEIRLPDVYHSKKYLDFGKGFYVTSIKEQAEKWAIRKSMRRKKIPIVNCYELQFDSAKYKVLRFDSDEKWLDFVCTCRRGKTINEGYDIVIGNVANDDVFKTVDMYFQGIWNKERTIQELRYYKKNNQICLVKQNVVDETLRFVKSYEVSVNGKQIKC